jgi:hypothetical protein
MNLAQSKPYIIGALVVFICGYTVGHYYSPEKIKEVIKEVKVTDTKKTTIIDKTVTPDGTTKERTVVKEVVHQNENKDSVKIEKVKSNWKVSALAGINKDRTPVYGASIEKNIIGPVNLGIWGTTSSEVGAVVSYEF